MIQDHEFLKKHYGLKTIPSPMDRVSKITKEKFDEYLRSGKPVIITDVADTWGMRNWTCDSISKVSVVTAYCVLGSFSHENTASRP